MLEDRRMLSVTFVERFPTLVSGEGLDGAGDYYGLSVALDGDWAVVGAPYDDQAAVKAGAAYVLEKTASGWVQRTKLTADDAEADDRFGYSVAIDGDTIVVGAYKDDDKGSVSGSVYVFTGSGSNWTQEQELTAADGAADDYFGISVAIDGDTVVVGASWDDDKGDNSGSAYVFTRTGSGWTEEQKLLAADGAADDYFGMAVAIDGDTVVVGASWDDDKGDNSGSAYVFTRTASVWTQDQKFLAADGAAGDHFGVAVAIDGDTVVVGAHRDDDKGNDSGSAYVFQRTGSIWVRQDKLLAADGAVDDWFGWSVAIDGDTVVVGAHLDDDKGSKSGSAYVFQLGAGDVWLEQQKLTAAAGAAGDWFGRAVAYNGSDLLVGADGRDDPLANYSGAVHTFEVVSDKTDIALVSARQTAVDQITIDYFTDGNVAGFELSVYQSADQVLDAGDALVTGQSTLPAAGPSIETVTLGIGTLTLPYLILVADEPNAVPENSETNNQLVLEPIGPLTFVERFPTLVSGEGLDGAGDYYGRSVALDGNWAVVGASYDDQAAVNAGAAYVLEKTASGWVQRTKLTADDAEASDYFGVSVAIDGDTILVGASAEDERGSFAGATYVFTGSDGNWTQQQKLLAADGAARDYFGVSMAIDGDTVVVGAPGDDDKGTDAGSAYVFTRTGSVWIEEQKFLAADGAAADHFGVSMAIDGDTVVVGASWDDQNGDKGSAYVFTRTGSVWTEEQKFLAADGAADDLFGWSVAIDGDMVVVGAYRDDDKGSSSGSAYVFQRIGSMWVRQDKLLAADGVANDLFGVSVAIDGDTVVVGAYGDDDKGLTSGSAYVFQRGAGDVWLEQEKLTATAGAAGDWFGRAVAYNGSDLLVGAYGSDDPLANDSGAVHVFEAQHAESDASIASAIPLGILSTGASATRQAEIGDGAYGGRDVDLYEFILAETATVELLVTAFQGQWPPAETPIDSYLRLFDASGNQIAAHDDYQEDLGGGVTLRGSEIETELPAGTYYVGVSGYPNKYYSPHIPGSGVDAGLTGPYTLGVSVAGGSLPPLLGDIRTVAGIQIDAYPRRRWLADGTGFDLAQRGCRGHRHTQVPREPTSDQRQRGILAAEPAGAGRREGVRRGVPLQRPVDY